MLFFLRRPGDFIPSPLKLNSIHQIIMGHILSERERSLLKERIAETEKQTGAQIVLATVRRCDSYAEIPWMAFAVGVSLAGLLILLLDIFVLGWLTRMLIQFTVVLILAAGILFALLSLVWPGFARLFLSEIRKEMETRQYAESLFLSHELFSTEGHRGILLLVSQFERQVVILPDKGVRDLLGEEKLKDIISKMTAPLRQKDMGKALETGLGSICEALDSPEPSGPLPNELSDEIIEEEGI